jgi:integrase
MPASPSLKAQKIDSRVAAGKAPWCVNVPAELSETGKRQRRFFVTERAAKAECETLKARRENFGHSLVALTPARIAAAGEAYRLLDPHGVDLLDAVRSHLRVMSEKAASVTFGAAFDRFAELKQTKSAKYQQEIRHAKAKFEPLIGKLICDVSLQDIEPILDTLPAASRNAKMRRLRSVFNLAIKRGWMLSGTSPIARLDFADGQHKEVEVIPVGQVAKMLDHALKNDLELLPFLTLGFFCGIRPDGELQKIEWRDIDLADHIVTIRPDVSKTQRRRFPEISENAIAWLEAYRQSGGRMGRGRVVPFSFSVLRKKRRANWKAIAGEKARWIQQGMRHTFCSNWLAIHGDINKLVLQSGHDSVDTMWRSYHKGVKKAQAEKFWAIMPRSLGLRKIVYFPSGASGK